MRPALNAISRRAEGLQGDTKRPYVCIAHRLSSVHFGKLKRVQYQLYNRYCRSMAKNS